MNNINSIDNINIDKINKLIDNCIDNTDYNISLVIYNILIDKYKYNSINNKWYYFEFNIWRLDKNLKNLKNDIKTIVINYLINRIIFLNKIAKNNYDTDIVNDYSIKSDKLLLICIKLNNNKFILTIIKEIKSLFEYNE